MWSWTHVKTSQEYFAQLHWSCSVRFFMAGYLDGSLSHLASGTVSRMWNTRSLLHWLVCREFPFLSCVLVGQHFSTWYPVVTVALVIGAILECGGHSAECAETCGRVSNGLTFGGNWLSLVVSSDPAHSICSCTSDVRMLSTAHETCCQSTVVVVTDL